MLNHLAGASINVANLVNYNYHPSRVWQCICNLQFVEGIDNAI